MSLKRTLLVAPVVAAFLLPACKGPKAPAATLAASPTAARAIDQEPLTPFDVQMFVAVRGRALQRLEDALTDVEQTGGDVLRHVQELTVAEREAARSLGVEWRRFTWVRDQVGRLLTSQRQREDQRVLVAELTRARQDLSVQLEAARDPASRQFLEAQLKALSAQMEKLERDQQLPTPQAEQAKLLEAARAEIATLQGRQDRVQHRLQALIERAAAASATPLPSRPTR
ncbi:MAG: hypothetical protein A2Y78_09765 [Acidobacteria bacterium RBG_13_68_16]|nr:MAG: hypothetical protein A2Y78_09765 [Acidobacteria bacterium RBG_13_68_16]